MFLIFDIGGSSTKIAILDEDTKIIKQKKVKSKKTLEEFLASIEEQIINYSKEFDIQAIGFSSPGTVDTITGEVGGISALDYLHKYNFAYHIQEKFNLPVAIENDANCSALAEMYLAKPKEKLLAFVVIGSGIGGAILFNGELIKSRRLESGEFGYMILEEENGELINFSKLATLPNVSRILEEKYGIHANTYQIMNQYSKRHEPFYSEVKKMYRYLAIGLYNIQYILDPEVIYIGGAISQSEDFMRDLRSTLNGEAFRDADINLRNVTYFNDNNIYGAYANLIKSIKEGRRLCIR